MWVPGIHFTVVAQPMPHPRYASDVADMTHITPLIARPQALPTTLIATQLSPARIEGLLMTQTEPLPASSSTLKVPVLSQVPATTSTAAPSVQPLSMEQCSALMAELGKLLTPYKAEGFWKALDEACLTSYYLLLVHDIHYSSPIGAPALLTDTIIMPNLASADR